MFEFSTTEDAWEKPSAKIKTAYITTVLLALFGLFFLAFVSQPLIYFLYGYDTNVISAYTAESFKAVHETFFARRLVFYIVLGCIFLCFVFSVITVIYRIHFSYYFNLVVLVVSFLFLLLFGIAMMIPTRAF